MNGHVEALDVAELNERDITILASLITEWLAQPGNHVEASAVRDFCRDMLEAAKVDGLDGCPLCSA